VRTAVPTYETFHIEAFFIILFNSVILIISRNFQSHPFRTYFVRYLLRTCDRVIFAMMFGFYFVRMTKYALEASFKISCDFYIYVANACERFEELQKGLRGGKDPRKHRAILG